MRISHMRFKDLNRTRMDLSNPTWLKLAIFQLLKDDTKEELRVMPDDSLIPKVEKILLQDTPEIIRRYLDLNYDVEDDVNEGLTEEDCTRYLNEFIEDVLTLDRFDGRLETCSDDDFILLMKEAVREIKSVLMADSGSFSKEYQLRLNSEEDFNKATQLLTLASVPYSI